MILRVNNLSARYNMEAEFIFEDVNFEVHSGEFVLLTGLSGSGKSTLLNTLNGTLQGEGLVEGHIKIDEDDVSLLSANDRSSYIASVLQNADEQIIFEKVEDELAFPLENMALSKDEMKTRIKKYAKMMKLNLSDRTSKLSGGQKQSLITAASFSMERKILLFDEPLANLDNQAAIRLLDTLNDLCKNENYIIIFSEHRIDLVLKYADKILYLNAGKVKSISDKTRFKEYIDHKVKSSLTSTLSSQASSLSSRAKSRDLKESKSIIFHLENLHFNVKKKEIIKGINYTFYEGEKYVIIGENGCGKSTLIKLLTGIYKASKGKITSPYGKKELFKKVGLVMQNPNYQLFMPSVEAELKLQSTDDNFLSYLIETFKLDTILDTHPHSLSEGQKRRLGVASILSMKPDVLILDEPSVGQDYKNMSAMIHAIQELLKLKDITVISISHDLRCMNNLGDIFLKLENGKLEEVLD